MAGFPYVSNVWSEYFKYLVAPGLWNKHCKCLKVYNM